MASTIRKDDTVAVTKRNGKADIDFTLRKVFGKQSFR